jgi:ferredoxin
MAKIKIEHDRSNCIGCGACASICPSRWYMNKDTKADLIDSTKVDGWEHLDISSDEFKTNLECAEFCPVNVIHIIKDDEKII